MREEDTIPPGPVGGGTDHSVDQEVEVSLAVGAEEDPDQEVEREDPVDHGVEREGAGAEREGAGVERGGGIVGAGGWVIAGPGSAH